jgi:PAS domain S-box-containing protein
MQDGIRVLYVDDEEDLLELGRIFLEENNIFSVDISPSAVASLQSPSLLSYDAIIADYQMPAMDGIAFLKEVRQRSQNLPFILFTGRGREEVVIEAINNGADFYLQKGGDPQAQFAELAHKVRQAVARRKSENEITSIFQAVPVGIAVVANRTLLRVNDRLCSLTGYPREELEGKNTRFLYLNDEDYSAVGRMRDQAYEGELPHEIEIPWRKKDGTIIQVLISAAPIDRSNPIAAMTYSALDVTRAKQDHNELRAAYEQLAATEEELRGQYEELSSGERRLRDQYEEITRDKELLKKNESEIAAILRAAPVGIGLITTGRVFLRVNDCFCRITGYSREELIGRDARFLYPDEDEYLLAGKFYTLGDGRGSYDTVETRFLKKDGTIRDVRFFGTPIDPADPSAGNIFVVLDITEEKRRRPVCSGQ